jgi:hypothetical protein
VVEEAVDLDAVLQSPNAQVEEGASAVDRLYFDLRLHMNPCPSQREMQPSFPQRLVSGSDLFQHRAKGCGAGNSAP